MHATPGRKQILRGSLYVCFREIGHNTRYRHGHRQHPYNSIDDYCRSIRYDLSMEVA